MAEIVRRQFLLIVVVILILAFCACQSDQSQTKAKGQHGSNRTLLAKFLKLRDNLLKPKGHLLQGRQGEGEEEQELEVWATCWAILGIPMGGQCDDPESAVFEAKIDAIIIKYNIDPDIGFIAEDPDNPEIPLNLIRDYQSLHCCELPLETHCVEGRCVCLHDPCFGNTFVTNFTVEECNRLADLIEAASTTAGPDVLGGANQTQGATAIFKGPGRGQGQLFVLAVWVIFLAIFGTTDLVYFQ